MSSLRDSVSGLYNCVYNHINPSDLRHTRIEIRAFITLPFHGRVIQAGVLTPVEFDLTPKSCESWFKTRKERRMSIQYVTGDTGDITAVIVPIQEWESVISKLSEIKPERNDTEYLLKSRKMKKRLLEAMNRTGGKTLEEVRNELGI